MVTPCATLMKANANYGVNPQFIPLYDSNAGSGATTIISFAVPYNYTETDSVILSVRPGATDATWDLDLAVEFGAAGEQGDIHSATDTTTTYNLTSGEMNDIDISDLFAGLTAGDRIKLTVTNQKAAILEIYGIEHLYYFKKELI